MRIMYRGFFYFAFLTFCSAAPYSDWSSAQSFPNQQQSMNIVRGQQQDQTDLVDTLGAGYEFFKKQPIVSRPLIQQKLAVSEQQVPITSLDDTSDQWSDYTRASAFKQQPVQTQARTSVPTGYGSQQQDINFRANLMSNNLVSQNQGSYGSAVDQGQQQGWQTAVQQQTLQPVQPLTRNFGSSYGQQQQDLQMTVPQQQPLIPNLSNSYGQQQQDLQTTFQQQQQPLPVVRPLSRNLGNSYGQQQQDLQTTFQQQQQQPLPVIRPLSRNFGNSYGQQQQQDLQMPVPQQQLSQVVQPSSLNLGNSYGQQQQQQQQDLQMPVPQQQPSQVVQPSSLNLGNSYGQQQQPSQFVQPSSLNLGNPYGQQQQQQDLQMPVPQQQPSQVVQPSSLNLGNSYGQQQQPSQFVQPSSLNLGNSYGQQQQQQDLRMIVPQQQPLPVIRPLSRNFGNSYGQQQQQDLQTIVPQQQDLQTTVSQQQPLIPNLSNSYGQQQLGQPASTVKLNTAYGQPAQPAFNDLISQGGYGQQVQQKIIRPILKTPNAGYGQQQPDISSVQMTQPSFSQQIGVPRSNLAFTSSSRFASQSQPAVPMSDSTSFGSS